MIKTVKGNILDRPEGINVIIHQANTQCVMGAGVALALKNKWPEVYEADVEAHAALSDKGVSLPKSELLGFFSRASIGDDLLVYNLYGQDLRRPSAAGCATDYNAVVKGFERIISNIIGEKEVRDDCEFVVGIPRLMGCGLAGGDWEIYESIIRAVFRNTGIPVVIVDFNS